LTLLGTRSAADGQGGAAILAGADGVQRAVPVGEEAMPGVRLAQVAFDHVVLQRPGGAVVLRLAGARQEATAPAPATLRFRLSEAGGVPALAAQGAEGRALGLLPGDRIVAVEGVAVRDARAATQLEAAMQSGRAVAVTVRRGDRALALSLGAAQ
jgi:general secretion pathway protein C